LRPVQIDDVVHGQACNAASLNTHYRNSLSHCVFRAYGYPFPLTKTTSGINRAKQTQESPQLVDLSLVHCTIPYQ